MIDRNLGIAERVLRLIGAVVLAGWAVTRDSHDILTPIALLAAAAFTMNFFFSRCYLWHVLGINSCENDGGECAPRPQGREQDPQ